MNESELRDYIERCNVMHNHRCTKSNLWQLRKALMANAEPTDATRLALAEAFGRCASSAPPVDFAEAIRRWRKFSTADAPNRLAVASELAEAGR